MEAHECMGRFEESKGSVESAIPGAANAEIDALGFKMCLVKGREVKPLIVSFLVET